MTLEKRFTAGIGGIAAPYDTAAALSGAKTEIIKRGAFASLIGKKVPLLIDHDPAQQLGEVRLHDTDVGLGYTFDAEVNPDNYSGVSIGFAANESTIKTEGDIDTITDCALKEISLISKQPYRQPAYPCTSVSKRSAERLSQWMDIHGFIAKNL